MPTAQSDRLEALVRDICSAAGSTGDEPRLVAKNLVYANLTGHDSHGVGMLPRYIQCSLTGELAVNQHAEIVVDHGHMLVIDGHAGYGQVIGCEAMDIGIERARVHGVCVLTIRHSFHLCRIGAWGERCAATGLVSMHHVMAMGREGRVAPFRGSDARFSTNPYCAVLPGSENNPPVVLDMATSIIAQGKVRVAHNKGEALPPGVLIDGEGNPTTDPGAMFRSPQGAIRTVGEHKGYGLALVNELLAGILSGGQTCRPETMHEQDTILNNMLSIIIDPMRLVAPDFYASELDASLAHVKASPPIEAGAPVLVPGDPERAMHETRSAHGIPIDDETWRQLLEAGRSVGLDPNELAARTLGNHG